MAGIRCPGGEYVFSSPTLTSAVGKIILIDILLIFRQLYEACL
jgi:hypothetical protein